MFSGGFCPWHTALSVTYSPSCHPEAKMGREQAAVIKQIIKSLFPRHSDIWFLTQPREEMLVFSPRMRAGAKHPWLSRTHLVVSSRPGTPGFASLLSSSLRAELHPISSWMSVQKP